MAAFDRRLLQRAREARLALAADAVIGTVAALLVLAQAILLADVAARSFDGASLHEVVLPLALVAAVFVFAKRSGLAFTLSAVGTLSIVATLFTSLYPRVMVSNPDFANSLTIQNASSAHYTLAVMSIVAAICVPLVLLYQGWTYHVFRARVGGDDLTGSSDAPTAVPGDSPAS